MCNCTSLIYMSNNCYLNVFHSFLITAFVYFILFVKHSTTITYTTQTAIMIININNNNNNNKQLLSDQWG